MEASQVVAILLGMLVALCALTDLWKGLIYNWVTVPAMVAGLALAAWQGGWAGLAYSAVGLVLCGGIMLLPFLVGGMGGGDVKLLAAVGALAGVGFGLRILLYSCLVGGLTALGLMVAKGRLRQGLRGTWLLVKQLADRNLAVTPIEPLKLPTLPFGVFVALGTAWARWFDLLPHEALKP